MLCLDLLQTLTEFLDIGAIICLSKTCKYIRNTLFKTPVGKEIARVSGKSKKKFVKKCINRECSVIIKILVHENVNFRLPHDMRYDIIRYAISKNDLNIFKSLIMEFINEEKIYARVNQIISLCISYAAFDILEYLNTLKFDSISGSGNLLENYFDVHKIRYIFGQELDAKMYKMITFIGSKFRHCISLEPEEMFEYIEFFDIKLIYNLLKYYTCTDVNIDNLMCQKINDYIKNLSEEYDQKYVVKIKKFIPE